MRAQLLPKGCKRLGGDDVKIGDFSFTKLLLLQHGLFIDFIFDFSHFSLYDQSRFMHVFVYILVGKWGGRRQDT